MKILLKIIILVLTFGFLGCTEFMDAPLDGRINVADIFSYEKRTEDKLYDDFALFQTQITDQGFLYGDRMLSAYCDEAFESDYNSRVTDWYLGRTSNSYNPAEGPSWNRLFEGVRDCNLSLKYLTDPNLAINYSLEKKQGYIAQNYAMRALYYLTIIKRYGGVPILDQPTDLDYDYSSVKRASFAQCVDFIIASCDSALSATTDETTSGFQWRHTSFDKNYKLTRAVVWAVKSQAALYAASPLWENDYEGTEKYTWDRVAIITKEALDQCLAKGYKLFDKNTAFQVLGVNCYDSYFLSEPSYNDDRDRETIYCNTRLSSRTKVWYQNGLPNTKGQNSAGACPSQELIDAYEIVDPGKTTAYNILNLSNPYSDQQHLAPNITPEAIGLGYNDNSEFIYKNRDPRFYATIYYDGAPRDTILGDLVFTHTSGNCAISSSQSNNKNTKTGYYLRKYFNPKSNVDNQIDGYFRVFRLAELYMNFAEAAFWAGGGNADYKIPATQGLSSAEITDMSAREAINKIRARVEMPPITENGQSFWLRYCNERRVEFAFEEHRFFDVRRWSVKSTNMLESTDQFVTGMVIVLNESLATYTRKVVSERNCYDWKYLKFPININEALKMQQLTGEYWQNDGWN